MSFRLASSTPHGTGPKDTILVQRALARDHQALEELLGRLGCVVRFVYRLNRTLGYGLPAEVLEDVVQQVYMAIWSRLRDYGGTASLESWAFGFCRNCLRAEARRRAQRAKTDASDHVELERSPSSDLLPGQAAERTERIDAVLDELEKLDPPLREAVVLRHLQGWSFEEIARRQGLPASTVKDRCYRALMRMRERLRRRDIHA